MYKNKLSLKQFNMSNSNKGINLSSISVFLPETILNNDELSAGSAKISEEIFKRTGVKERRRTCKDFQMSDMACAAAEKIFNSKNELREKIDALILVGHGFEYKAPVTSAILHQRLGLNKNCLVLDVPHGCTGYIYGLSIAKGFLSSQIAKNVLLLTSDTPSYVIDKNDAELQSLFGDAATATIVQSSEENEKFVFGTDGSGYEDLIVRRSGTRNPATIDWITKTGLIHGKMEMRSTEIFTFAIKIVPVLIYDILEKNNMKIEDIDYFVFHQANSFLLEVIRKKLKIQKEKFFNDITLTGNTVSSSIPLALHTAEKNGVLRSGMKVLIAGFGIGLSWGGTIIKY